MKMTYSEFQEYMRSDGYADREIRRLFHAFKSMDNQSRSWLIWWIAANRLPDDEIEGVTARYLIEDLKYKPVNAFVILDWLKSDPQAAKYFVLKQNVDANIGDEAAREAEQIMQAEDPDRPSSPPSAESDELDTD